DVVAVDRRRSGESGSSSAGTSRIFRLGHADAGHVGLAAQALDLWGDLERRSGRVLIARRGLIERGEPALAVATALGERDVAHALLEDADARNRFPELADRPGEPILFHEAAGTILARPALEVQARLAGRAGAELREFEEARHIEQAADHVVVRTSRRALEADVAVVCAGAASLRVLEPVGITPPLVVEAIQTTFFSCNRGAFERPLLIDWYPAADRATIYGMPMPEVGYKLGLVASRRPASDVDASKPDLDEVATLARRARLEYPGLGPALRTEACPITTTPDGDFVLDRVGRVVIACGCNGQAFKFSPLIGELLASLAEGRSLDGQARRFRLDRAGLAGPARTFSDAVRTNFSAG
ncbi:MAG: FAD-dependent oxidoreductase, partial [Gaiellales bacterium]